MLRMRWLHNSVYDVHTPIYVQEYSTNIYESHHKDLKVAGRETNSKNSTFERDQTRRAGHHQSVAQLRYENPAFKSIYDGVVKGSHINEGEGRVCMTRVRPAEPDYRHSTKNTLRPLMASRVPAVALVHPGGDTDRRIFYVVRFPEPGEYATLAPVCIFYGRMCLCLPMKSAERDCEFARKASFLAL